ncbi:TetR/AcrR family transcriptional regulator [Lacrimispora algidixylanolytica]|uniref:TetR family transcriptional regulator n=1 Tax=Lacrimispora algidixylanolytica TaxID=94868 RepID=A0A419T7C5_9FIRM|nr:TetR/AcrR family transcriptional regulator [Lacrimispora algidixylanolytica]RKD33319.1 TetR family transcriptional regulator [Lacrimispora algidixylanolytica]
MKIIKNPEERKNEILDAADKLFTQKGFDGTSTNDILEAVGIARGTLYYHFKSKEDIMDSLIDRYSTSLLTRAKEVADNKSIPVYERIVQTVMALNMNHVSGKEIIEHIHKPQNALMHFKAQKAILNGLTPILTEIIKEGIEQGLCTTPYPYEAIEMLVVYTNTVFDGNMIDLTDEDRILRVKAFVFHTERLLGVERGTLSLAHEIFERDDTDES